MNNVDGFLQNLDVSTISAPLSKYQKFTLWMHNHPTAVNCTKVALYTLGAGLVIGSVGAAATSMLASAIVLGLSGATVLAVTWITFKILGLIVSPHQMSNHMFTPGQCDGGELYYDGDVPILKLTDQDPFKAGKAHGYLIAHVLSKLRNTWDVALHTIGGISRPSEALDLIAKLKKQIPDEYIREMEGVAEGYNKWLDENGGGIRLTIEDLIFYHLLPDSIHFKLPTTPNFISKILGSTIGTLACTAIVDRDEKKGPIFARNMDWPSLGVAGAFTLMIQRPGNTLEVGLPGFVGTLTGMNLKTGLCVAMNVCGNGTDELNTEVKGMPACLYNRFVLDNCKKGKDIPKALKHRSPLGEYHMTWGDPEDAGAVHMYQGDNKNSHFERLLDHEKEPLIVTNCRYSTTGEQSCHLHYSNERDGAIKELFKKATTELPKQEVDKEKLLQFSLSLPHVNNYETTHSILMIPSTRTMKVAFNNEYSGTDTLQEVHVR